jgi:putative membrane-bound dehydrogenase-like protein
MRYFRIACLLLAIIATAKARAADANRLTYLDESDPYYVSRHFPKLVTPQWVGDKGVEAVVILAIDDMRDPARYEAFLRPILRRLKQIDGRAPVSIMSNKVNPRHPQLQEWLKEGLSLETHTVDHPCPFFQGGDFAKARANYDGCVDLLNEVPGSRPVAFRMPCCDSLNTLSPRFFAEMFNQTTPKGHFLTIDSSVFNIITANDPALPRTLVLDADGQDRFRKYLPSDRSFVNTIEDYPYPYVIGRLCWEFPCATPSDWQANHLHKPGNPVTVRDWKAVLDATVLKQGVFALVFHPHGWIRNEQIVELIDHAVARHGTKVKFLTFAEAQERLNKHLLGGHSLRAASGHDNGVRLIDLNNDGYLDVVIGSEKVRQTRLWSPKTRTWITTEFPVPLVTQDTDGRHIDAGVRFGIVRPDGYPTLLVRNESLAGAWHFDGAKWLEDKNLLAGLEVEGRPVLTSRQGRDRGVRLRDLDKDGRCELIVGNEQQQAIFTWSTEKKAWEKLPFTLPPGTSLVNAAGKDSGLRFVDLDEDGYEDVLFSNAERYSLHLFTGMQKGWSREVLAGRGGDQGRLPMIARNGTNNGAWFHSRGLWVHNEDSALLRDHVERRSFNDLLEGVEPGPKTPQASLRSIRTRPGFEVELIASEPLVQSPIAFAWGADGKLWVVEMGDYPLGVDGKGKPGGRVKYLESTKGDGKYDKATLFLDNLSFPTGVTPWRKGVLVTCAPEIFYAESTSGHGRADRREVLFTGFIRGNPQHRLNGLWWGLDNWLYGANGDSGGTIRSKAGGAEVNIRGRDFRIRPDDGIIDAQTGQTQYGRCRDDWGDWFGCNNSNPMYHFVFADQYLRRNPYFAAPDPRVPVSVTPGAAPVYPVSRTLPRFNDPGAANHFTSACSVTIYRDDLFGPAFAGNSFVSEPVHNLIHREIMAAEGVTFKSRRAVDEQQSEFLASSDNWFRPTTIRMGPDGALWIADMYRQVIEHPEWIPKDWQKSLDLRAGHDKGRIYRVYPVGQRPRPIPRLDRLDAAGLVAALDSPSGWQRDMAQQLLVERRDRTAVPLLEKMAADNERPLARLHALCTLDGIAELKPAVVQRALADPHPGVRRHAVRLCETRLAKASELGDTLIKLVTDPEPAVRMQLAYTLGDWEDPRAGRALGQLALADAADRYLLAAVMSSVTEKNLDVVLETVLKDSKHTAPSPALIESLVRMSAAVQDRATLIGLMRIIAAPRDGKYAPWQFTAVAALLDTLDQRNTSLADLARGDEGQKAALNQALAGIFGAARAAVADKQASRSEQVLAIRLLGRGLDRRAADIKILESLLVPQTASDLQAAAVAALGQLRDPLVPELLLRGWKGYGPALRSQVLDVLSRHDDWMKTTLDAVDRKAVLPFEVDAARRQRWLQHRNDGIRHRAAKVFAVTVDPDRKKVVEAYRSVLTLKGDAGRGQQVFTKTCAACHRLGGVGQAVGPDLASIGDKSPESLLVAILDPNQAVEARYINYLAVTKAGVTVTGVLASETGNSITLVGPDGKAQVILRADLEELASTGKSAMPEGLEKDLKPQDMADVIAHIRAGSPPPKRKVFDGNKPEVVRPAADGTLRLPVSACEIYGTTVVLEKQYGNLGYWSSENDHAVWTVEVTRPGKYALWLDFACDDGSAGNAFVVQAGAERLTGKVASTGGWDDYKQTKVGDITLAAGQQRVVFRSSGKIAGALIDLRAIKLVPAGRE